MTTPTPQRRITRRADRYKQSSGVSPSTELMQRTAAPAPPPELETPPVIPAPAPQLERSGIGNAPPRRTQAARLQASMAQPQTVAPSLPPMQERHTSPAQAAAQAAYTAPAGTPPSPGNAVQTTQRMPRWLFLSLIGCMFVILTMITASSLMNAYLVTRQEEREAAYARVLDNHPMQYQELIERYANENNLHPAFVAAIILNESSFRTGAESSVGARGLMQLMPDTAEWVAGKRDDDGYHFDDMYTAEKNIQYGTWYLGYLAKLFRGDAILVAAAYHAGQGEVTGWLGNPSMSPDGLTISLENMIEGNTKTYVGRVTQAYAIYEAIYYPEAAASPSAALSATGADSLRAAVR